MKIFTVILVSLVLFFMPYVCFSGEDDILVLSASTTAITTDLSTASGQYLYFSNSNYSDNGVKRYVQVFVVDPDKNVVLKDSILYKSEPFMTDETDQEIRHSLNINSILEKHNSKRVKMRDSESSKKYGRDIYLDPIKLRDLRIVIATLAKF